MRLAYKLRCSDPLTFSHIAAVAFVLLLEIYSVTLGQMFAALSPTEYIAEQMVPFALVIFCLFCGASYASSPLALPGTLR